MTVAAVSATYRFRPESPPAVDGVCLRIGRGELVAVVGPNGAGKSTLLALLAGWLRPLAGRVELEGRPLARWSARQRAQRLAYLPQDAAPLYDLTVEEVVAAGRHPYRSPWSPLAPPDRQIIDSVLDATDAAHVRGRPFSTLSGGERQRVQVASVLAQEPAVLLLDEPTASLDPHHRVEVFRLLEAAVADGKGVAVVTHDLNLASLFADRVVLMVGGRLLREGPPVAVLDESVLRRAYGPELVVVPHPVSGRPAVLPDTGGTP